MCVHSGLKLRMRVVVVGLEIWPLRLRGDFLGKGGGGNKYAIGLAVSFRRAVRLWSYDGVVDVLVFA